MEHRWVTTTTDVGWSADSGGGAVRRMRVMGVSDGDDGDDGE